MQFEDEEHWERVWLSLAADDTLTIRSTTKSRTQERERQGTVPRTANASMCDVRTVQGVYPLEVTLDVTLWQKDSLGATRYSICLEDEEREQGEQDGSPDLARTQTRPASPAAMQRERVKVRLFVAFAMRFPRLFREYFVSFGAFFPTRSGMRASTHGTAQR